MDDAVAPEYAAKRSNAAAAQVTGRVNTLLRVLGDLFLDRA